MPLSAAGDWINSPGLTTESLRGKVVLVDFWTYTCINSLRNLPYIKAWAEKYKAAGLVVVGVHSPEFSFEHERPNVEQAVRDLEVTYPVVLDSDYRIWRAFNNEFWPGDYVLDGKQRIVYQHFGEGDYAASERAIQRILKEHGASAVPPGTVVVAAEGIEARADFGDEGSSETYLGYRRAEGFGSPGPLARDARRTYTAPVNPPLNHWGLDGSWTVGPERAALDALPGGIVYRFRSRDLHLVLAPAKNGDPIRFRIRLDGAAPGGDHGWDTIADGSGEVHEPRLYQLIRQKGRIGDRTFAIEFLDPGVQAVVFTFG